MRATLSLLQAWLFGVGVFIAMTAAFCIAMIVAISGPPTGEEMRGVRAAGNIAMRDLSRALGRVGEDLCARFPQTVGADAFCSQPEQQVQSRPATVSEEAPPPPPPPPSPSAARRAPPETAPAADPPNLLGASEAPASRAPGRTIRHVRRRRAAGMHPPGPHRPAPIEAPAITAPVAAAPPDEPVLVEVRPTIAHVVEPLPQDAPAQNEAPSRTDDKSASPSDAPGQAPANSLAL